LGLTRKLTGWSTEDRHSQQGPYPAHQGSHSLAGEQRTGVISWDQIQLTTEATHKLESQGQALLAGTISSSPRKPLTRWRAEDRHHQLGPNPAPHESHSQTGEQRIGIITKSSSPWKPLTSWRGKDKHYQLGQNPACQGSHSPTGEQMTGMVSREQIQLTTEATHSLKSRQQASSAGIKFSSPWKSLTCWGAMDRYCQQGPNPAHQGSCSLPGEPRTGIVSGDQIQLTMEATHFLKSQGQALSVGAKSSSPWKPLTA